MNEKYPLWRDYQLWELDGYNCQLITGMSYEQLRLFASTFSTGGRDQNMNDPLWDKVMRLDARSVWEARKQWQRDGKEIFA